VAAKLLCFCRKCLPSLCLPLLYNQSRLKLPRVNLLRVNPTRIQLLAMSQYFHYQQDKLFVENVALADIAERFDTPCYVYSRAALTDAYLQFSAALKGREHLICFAVKSNPSLAILNLFARLGAGFDIVSGGEARWCFPAWARARLRCARLWRQTFYVLTWNPRRNWFG
jgi:hypothetical protein